MTKPRGTFAQKGKAILDGATRPKRLSDFLAPEAAEEDAGGEATATPPEPPGTDAPSIRHDVNTARRVPEKSVRQELRLTEELGERLRRYAYEKRLKKNEVVHRALAAYLEKDGY